MSPTEARDYGEFTDYEAFMKMIEKTITCTTFEFLGFLMNCGQDLT